MGEPLRKERCSVKLEERLFHHAARKVGNIYRVNSIAEPALKTVAVETPRSAKFHDLDSWLVVFANKYGKRLSHLLDRLKGICRRASIEKLPCTAFGISSALICAWRELVS